jgi:hypothetical protein
MAGEAAAIRTEMSHTRASLDRKIAELEVRAKELTPRAYAERHLPEYLMERVIGGVLTLVGLRMAWSLFHKRHDRRRRDVRTAMASYGRW